MSAEDDAWNALREKWLALVPNADYQGGNYPFMEPGKPNFSPFVIFPSNNGMCLDGDFTLAQLEQLVAWWKQVVS